MRLATWTAIIFLALQTSGFADPVAISEQAINPRIGSNGKILGRQTTLVDTYGINLAAADGVRPRDVYEVRRNKRKVAEAVVVYVANNYSLVSLRGSGETKLQTGDKVVYLRHADTPPVPVVFEHHDPIIIEERNFRGSRIMPGGGFSPHISFQGPSFSNNLSFAYAVPVSTSFGLSGPSFGPPNLPTSIGIPTSLGFSSGMDFTQRGATYASPYSTPTFSIPTTP